jgi:hypothetical protein
MKKIHLIFASLSIVSFLVSCAPEAEDGNPFGDSNFGSGGIFTTPFTVTDAPAGVELGGIITANAGTYIVWLQIRAGSNALIFIPHPVLPAPIINLSTYGIGGVCVGLNGSQSLKFEVTVMFSEGDKLVGSKTAIIDCGP